MDIALKEGTETVVAGLADELLRRLLLRFREFDPVNACWLWTSGRTSDGYGFIWLYGKRYFTHRLMFALDKGEIQAGKLILHSCPGGDQPACFNPGHLRAGTGKENAADREQRKTGA